MARLVVERATSADVGFDNLAKSAARRVTSLLPEQCPVDFTGALMRLYLTESCGKCTPCRVGLAVCTDILDAIMAGEGTPRDVERLGSLARSMYESADCAIGFQAGWALGQALASFKDDFASHVQHDRCAGTPVAAPPCRTACPAHVDIPSYIACVENERYADALRVIRNDNPLPTVCGYVCEHPCEMVCRRALVDDAVNICGLKRFAADEAEEHTPPAPLPATGKRVSIVGGGPAGLTAAYYLRLMGHDVAIYEQRCRLGGMVRYGIPDYRLPQDKLDADIDFILSTGVEAHLGVAVGVDVPFDDIAAKSDAVYLSIGAHADKKLGCPGEDARGVVSAVEFLRSAGQGAPMNLAGARVVVVGGGNVAMDCTRTARRLGASTVECVYRRRISDMTALPEEIAEAFAEGCQITQLEAPVRIESDGTGQVTALITQPQVIGDIGRDGRPRPYAADVPERRIGADVVIVAIGQAVDADAFASVPFTDRGLIVTGDDGAVHEVEGLFAGGDAVSGPSTVIRAIAAGKVAAANIDAALGFSRNVHDYVDVPAARMPKGPCGRVELKDVNFGAAVRSFDIAKIGMSEQEAARCLRCDHYGFGATCEKGEPIW